MNKPHRIISEINLPDNKADSFPLIRFMYKYKDKEGNTVCKPSTALWELVDKFYFEN